METYISKAYTKLVTANPTCLNYTKKPCFQSQDYSRERV